MLADMRIDLNFDHHYEIRLAEEIPGSPGRVEQFYYPGASNTGIAGQAGGFWITVTPQNRLPWMGSFAKGYQSPRVVSAMASSPNPKMFCVVSSGLGCIVNAEEPGNWIKVDCFPVLDFRSIPSAGILLFADFTKLVAYGTDGQAWRTQDLCLDELRIQDITTELIVGTGWNAPKIEVDLKTGEILRRVKP